MYKMYNKGKFVHHNVGLKLWMIIILILIVVKNFPFKTQTKWKLRTKFS